MGSDAAVANGYCARDSADPTYIEWICGEGTALTQIERAGELLGAVNRAKASSQRNDERKTA